MIVCNHFKIIQLQVIIYWEKLISAGCFYSEIKIGNNTLLQKSPPLIKFYDKKKEVPYQVHQALFTQSLWSLK